MAFSIPDLVAGRAKRSDVNDRFNLVEAVLNTLSPGQIIAADAASAPRPVTMSGHGSLSGAGALTINDLPLDALLSGAASQIIVCNASGVPQYVSQSGDVTVSQAGAFAIGADKVTTAKIADDAVTPDKQTAVTGTGTGTGSQIITTGPYVAITGVTHTIPSSGLWIHLGVVRATLLAGTGITFESYLSVGGGATIISNRAAASGGYASEGGFTLAMIGLSNRTAGEVVDMRAGSNTAAGATVDRANSTVISYRLS